MFEFFKVVIIIIGAQRETFFFSFTKVKLRTLLLPCSVPIKGAPRTNTDFPVGLSSYPLNACT